MPMDDNISRYITSFSVMGENYGSRTSTFLLRKSKNLD